MLEYHIWDKLVDNFEIPAFGRQIKIKWWANMKTENFSESFLENWFTQNPKYSISKGSKVQSQFLLSKSNLQTWLAVVKSEE